MSHDYKDPDWMLPISRKVEEAVRSEVEARGQITLGAFIAELEKLPPENAVHIEPLYLKPGKLDSYRGYYDHLALAFEVDGTITVGELLDDAKAAMGRTFTGYKGGDYVMSEHTPLWIANYGNSGGLRVTGVETYKDSGDKLSHWTTIKTARDDD